MLPGTLDKSKSLLYWRENKAETVEIWTKPWLPKRKQLHPGPQRQDHLTGNNIQSEDVRLQTSSLALASLNYCGHLSQCTKLSSARRRKNAGLSAQFQDCPPYKVFTIEIEPKTPIRVIISVHWAQTCFTSPIFLLYKYWEVIIFYSTKPFPFKRKEFGH